MYFEKFTNEGYELVMKLNFIANVESAIDGISQHQFYFDPDTIKIILGFVYFKYGLIIRLIRCCLVHS